MTWRTLGELAYTLLWIFGVDLFLGWRIRQEVRSMRRDEARANDGDEPVNNVVNVIGLR